MTARNMHEMKILQDELMSRLNVKALELDDDMAFSIELDDIKALEGQFSAEAVMRGDSLCSPRLG